MNRWADFQRDFGAAIRRPLDASGGTLRPSPGELAVYNRQYWLRLFTTMQQEYPLVARLKGFWSFNLLVQEFLQVHPPVHYDLQSIAEPFPAYLVQRQEDKLLIQAAQLDRALSEIFLAPNHKPWRLTPERAAGLAECQLIPSPSWRIVSEDWALWELSTQLPQLPQREQALPRPKTWDLPQHGLIHRLNLRMMRQRLSAAQADFYQLLLAEKVGVALALIREKYPETDLAPLIQQWMMQSVEWELWASP